MTKILLVEDEAEAGAVLSEFLTLHGFAVSWATKGPHAQSLLETEVFALAILDVMLPPPDGYELLAFIRSRPATARLPVLFLTARDQDEDEILGLMSGADDYLRKPAALSLVLAHIQTLLRRAAPAPDIHLLPDAYTAAIEGRKLDLTHTEFQLLQLFMTHRNRVFSRQELIDVVRGESSVFDRTMDAHIKNLRMKLGDRGGLIRTYRGVGYGWNRDAV